MSRVRGLSECECRAGKNVMLGHVSALLGRWFGEQSQLGLNVMTVRREGKFSLQVVAKEVCCDSATVSMPLVAIGIAR